MDFLKAIGETLSGLGDKIIGFLPKSPFYYIEANPEVKQVLRHLNWFIPIDTMLALTEAWLTAIAIYYVVQAILRWAKVID